MLGVSNQPQIISRFEEVFKQMWIQNGDQVSKMYAGTCALEGKSKVSNSFLSKHEWNCGNKFFLQILLIFYRKVLTKTKKLNVSIFKTKCLIFREYRLNVIEANKVT